MTAGPTPRQMQVLAAITLLTARHGYPPTVRELCKVLRVRSTNGVAQHLESLRRKKLVTWMRNSSRTLRVTEADNA